MSEFNTTTLEAGEEIIFGIATQSSSSSHRRVENGRVTEDVNTSSTRRVGVTDRRLILETDGEPEATWVIPNSRVRRVFLKREDFMGSPRLEMEEIETDSAERIPLGIGFLEAEDEARIRATFPAAELVETAPAPSVGGAGEQKKKKGFLSFLGF